MSELDKEILCKLLSAAYVVIAPVALLIEITLPIIPPLVPANTRAYESFARGPLRIAYTGLVAFGIIMLFSRQGTKWQLILGFLASLLAALCAFLNAHR